MKKNVFMVVIVQFLSVIILTHAVAQDSVNQSSRLFVTTGDEVRDISQEELDYRIIRRRSVAVDFDLLNRARLDAIMEIQLNLFDDVQFEGRIERKYVRSSERYSIIGSIGGEQTSRFIFTVRDGYVLGSVRDSSGNFYRLQYTSEGSLEIREVEDRRVFTCDTPSVNVARLDAPNPESPPTLSASFTSRLLPPSPTLLLQNCTGGDYDNGSTFNILVVYTDAAKDAEGGTGPMETLVDQTVDEMNDGFDNSNVMANVQLVHQQEISFAETSYGADVIAVADPDDTKADDVPIIRDYYFADFVVLVGDWGQVNGRAFSIPRSVSAVQTFAESAFCVVDRQGLGGTGYFVFAHELGHLMGLLHDTDSGTDVYDYAHGYKFAGDPSGTEYDTIMVPGGAGGDTRINYHSNPDVEYDGTATGTAADADCARVIDNLDDYIANWRSAPPILFKHKDSGGQNIFSIDEQGNVVIEGDLKENATSLELDAVAGDTFLLYYDDDEIVRVDSSGKMWMDGTITDALSCPLTASSEILKIKNGSGEVVAYFDTAGNLKLTGKKLIWKDGDPDPTAQ